MARSDHEAARRAWQTMSELTLSHDRKTAVSEALKMSWARVWVLRYLAKQPLTLRGLADKLNADPPYITIMVDDLEDRGLVRREPHPDDRRAKLVSLTVAGRKAADQAEEMLGAPPAALRELPAKDIADLQRILSRLNDD